MVDLSGPVEAFAGLAARPSGPAILAEGASDELLAARAASCSRRTAYPSLPSEISNHGSEPTVRLASTAIGTTRWPLRSAQFDPQDLPAIVTRTHTPLIFVHELTASDVITHSAHPTGPQPGVSGQKHRSPHSPNQDEQAGK